MHIQCKAFWKAARIRDSRSAGLEWQSLCWVNGGQRVWLYSFIPARMAGLDPQSVSRINQHILLPACTLGMLVVTKLVSQTSGPTFCLFTWPGGFKFYTWIFLNWVPCSYPDGLYCLSFPGMQLLPGQASVQLFSRFVLPMLLLMRHYICFALETNSSCGAQCSISWGSGNSIFSTEKISVAH